MKSHLKASFIRVKLDDDATAKLFKSLSLARISSEEAEFIQLVAPKFSPLLLVLRPSELPVRQLLVEVFCALEEQDLELKSLTTFLSAMTVYVSARDFALVFR